MSQPSLELSKVIAAIMGRLHKPMTKEETQEFFMMLHHLANGDIEGFEFEETTSQNLIEGMTELLWVLGYGFEEAEERDIRLRRAYHWFLAYFKELNFESTYPNVATVDLIPPLNLIRFFRQNFRMLGKYQQNLNVQEKELLSVNMLLLNYLRDAIRKGTYAKIPPETVAKIVSAALSFDKPPELFYSG